MNTSSILCGLLIAVAGSSGKMDRSISGKGTDRHHESIYDDRQKLYLYAGGD